jgi:hypothetical protein
MDTAAQPTARSEDPKTSLEAARRAAHASWKAIDAVERVMRDGVARMDEEIRQACENVGLLLSQDTVRHARMALASDGRLVRTGARRATKTGTLSLVWIKAGSSG